MNLIKKWRDSINDFFVYLTHFVSFFGSLNQAYFESSI